jgi:hypothetical protein
VNPGQEDLDLDGQGDACDPDNDDDGVPNASDNCPIVVNPGQQDTDLDGQGDACDPDNDDDGVPNASDNCPIVVNPGQQDTDGNGIGDACNNAEDTDGDEFADALDNCSAVPNPGQEDSSGDGIGDVCNDEDLDGLVDSVETSTGVFVDENDTGTDPLDPDSDADGLLDGLEVLEYGSDPLDPDTDADMVIDGQDNCVLVANLDQADADAGVDDNTKTFPPFDQYGDRCDADTNNDGLVNTADFFGDFRPCFGLAVATTPSCATSDFDGNGIINTGDFFAYFLPQFGGEPGPGRRIGLEFTFTTCGQTGRTGPSQSQCDGAYQGTDLAAAVNVVEGIQYWVVPATGTYVIEARGAGGASLGGLGARMSGELDLQGGTELAVLVGQNSSQGSGGGSFVILPAATPGVIAGGGGAGGSPGSSPGQIGEAGASGQSTQESFECFDFCFPIDPEFGIEECFEECFPSVGGVPVAVSSGGNEGSGGGGAQAGGGGGLLFDGENGTIGLGSGGVAFQNGGAGGIGVSLERDGGFGGGGGSYSFGGGGGGGFSGGGGGETGFFGGAGAGGGGGSYNAGTNQDNASGVNAGPGQVTITFLSAAIVEKTLVSEADLAFLMTFAPESDADADGLSDGAEMIYGTDPLKADTDADGILDGDEVQVGSNPLASGAPPAVPTLGLGPLAMLFCLLLTAGMAPVLVGRMK